MGAWIRLVAAGVFIVLGGCRYGTHMVGFIPTEPVSLPTAKSFPHPLCLNVSDVRDTLRIVSRNITVKEVQHTTEFALAKAFEASFPLAQTDDAKNCYVLRMVSMEIDYRPMEHYQHRWMDGTSSNYREFSIDVAYKALLYDADTLMATFDNVVSQPEVSTIQMDLKKAVERMAEDLNAKVIRFLLGQKAE